MPITLHPGKTNTRTMDIPIRMILEARKVEEEQKELMKNNPFYQSFEEKGE